LVVWLSDSTAGPHPMSSSGRHLTTMTIGWHPRRYKGRTLPGESSDRQSLDVDLAGTRIDVLHFTVTSAVRPLGVSRGSPIRDPPAQFGKFQMISTKVRSANPFKRI